MGKIICLAAALLLLMSAAGCGNSQEPETAVPTLADSSPKGQTEEAGDTQDQSGTRSSGQTDPGKQKSEEEIMRISVKSENYEIIYQLNSSRAAAQLYAQLPLTVEAEPFGNNEITFYPEALNTEDAPLSSGEPGSLSYYEPWGDVVMFYASCPPNNSLYELGTAVSGAEHIASLRGTITVSAVE